MSRVVNNVPSLFNSILYCLLAVTYLTGSLLMLSQTNTLKNAARIVDKEDLLKDCHISIGVAVQVLDFIICVVFILMYMLTDYNVLLGRIFWGLASTVLILVALGMIYCTIVIKSALKKKLSKGSNAMKHVSKVHNLMIFYIVGMSLVISCCLSGILFAVYTDYVFIIGYNLSAIIHARWIYMINSKNAKSKSTRSQGRTRSFKTGSMVESNTSMTE